MSDCSLVPTSSDDGALVRAREIEIVPQALSYRLLGLVSILSAVSDLACHLPAPAGLS